MESIFAKIKSRLTKRRLRRDAALAFVVLKRWRTHIHIKKQRWRVWPGGGVDGKRIFDVALIVLSLPVLLPVLLALALLVRRRLGAPVLFRQQRPGLHGEPFMMIKFRSMTDERGPDGELLPDEQRLTRFGRLLRSASLDELPELWNVLKGEMSLVGPRPLLMQYLPLYNERQARRHEVRPGVSGWAQVNGRNAISWPEKFELDVWYVDNHNLWLDLRIIWMTLEKVLRRDGVSADKCATMPFFTGNNDADAVKEQSPS